MRQKQLKTIKKKNVVKNIKLCIIFIGGIDMHNYIFTSCNMSIVKFEIVYITVGKYPKLVRRKFSYNQLLYAYMFINKNNDLICFIQHLKNGI